MNKGKLLYSGKTKSIYKTDDPQLLIMAFRDDATAFNAQKKATLSGKGRINNLINAHLSTHLSNAGIPTHFVRQLTRNESIVKALTMIPVECVMRNFTAGTTSSSLCTRFGFNEGIKLDPPIFEFFYKDDRHGDPFINESHIQTFQWATRDEINQMKTLTLRVNELLKPLFLSKGILLVDYKLEFGRFQGDIYLGDEFTPDGCRLWDVETLEKFDKDRFRRDLGHVVKAYQEVAHRLGIE